MALGPRLELRQSQALVMTPQLQQAIKLLQMSNLELNVYVDQELEQNPLLEREENDGGLDVATETPGEEPPGEDGAADGGSSEDAPETPDSAELATSETLQEGD